MTKEQLLQEVASIGVSDPSFLEEAKKAINQKRKDNLEKKAKALPKFKFNESEFALVVDYLKSGSSDSGLDTMGMLYVVDKAMDSGDAVVLIKSCLDMVATLRVCCQKDLTELRKLEAAGNNVTLPQEILNGAVPK